METGGGEGRALVRASSNAGKLTSGGRQQAAAGNENVNESGRNIRKIHGCLYKRCLCNSIQQIYTFKYIYIYVRQLFTNIFNNFGQLYSSFVARKNKVQLLYKREQQLSTLDCIILFELCSGIIYNYYIHIYICYHLYFQMTLNKWRS